MQLYIMQHKYIVASEYYFVIFKFKMKVYNF